MKTRLLLLFLFAPISMFLAAQTDNPHLTFMGIPIDGDLSSFTDKLKDKGFTLRHADDTEANLYGKFASYQNCNVTPRVYLLNGLVYNVIVYFPEFNDWSDLSNCYFSLKSKLIKKYGDYSSCTEKFHTDMLDLDDSNKMLLVQSDEFEYETCFSTSKGIISIAISAKCKVLLSYVDDINSEFESRGDIEE